MKTELVNKKNIGRYASLLGSEEMQAVSDRKCSAVGVYEGGEPLGILTFSRTPMPDGKKGYAFFVDHYYVVPERRREGIFKSLLEMVHTACKKQKIKGITIQTVQPGMEEIEEAIKALGFKKITDGNRIYHFDLAGMEGGPLMSFDTAKHDMRALSVSELTPSQRRAFLASFRKRFPKELGPGAAGGPILNDFSYVYVAGSDVKGYLLSGSFKKDEIYLSALLVTPKYRHAAVILLKRFFADLMADGRYSRILFAAVNDASDNLAKHLFEFNSITPEEQVVRNYYIKA